MAKPCILFVDDEPVVAGTAGQMFELFGYDAVIKQDPCQALELFRRHPGRFDLVITDQAMPEMEGMELARAIRAVRDNLPVVLISGFADEAMERQAASLGIAAVFAKPFNIPALAAKLHELLGE